MNEHTPQLSIWPMIVALALTLIMIGILASPIVAGLGIALLLASLWMWVQENRLSGHHVLAEHEEQPHE